MHLLTNSSPSSTTVSTSLNTTASTVPAFSDSTTLVVNRDLVETAADACVKTSRVVGAAGLYSKEYMYELAAFELRQKVLGPEHPDTLISMSNLAHTLDEQGKHVEAKVMQQQVLELRQKVLGPEHPDTLFSVSNLANTMGKLGKQAEADKMNTAN